MPETIRLSGVNKRFGGVVVANNVELTLEQGEILGLIGPNGAGKTSLFNLISGIIIPDSGAIYFQEQSINKLGVFQRARLGISRTWQNIRLFPSLSVMDNLLMGSRRYEGEFIMNTFLRRRQLDRITKDRMAKASHLLDRVGLRGQGDTLVTELPFGQQKLTALVRALMNDGRCLLLDEPMAGVEADVYETMKAVVREEAGRGRAVCVIEHSIAFIRDLCHTAVFLFNGEIIARGTVGELLCRPELVDIYFGCADAGAWEKRHV
ncbi:MAG: ATP-binding cassette domain-containing protein [Thermodesulfobacteriota bacterium]